MKNKKLLYFLIPVVLLIWGSVVYKILAVSHSDNDSNSLLNKDIASTKENENLVDTFSIYPDYPDPFLRRKINKTFSTEGIITLKPASKPVEIKKVAVTATVWPKLVYGGLIKNQKSKKLFALVQIGENSSIMKIGDMVQDIELTKIFRDTIEVKFNNEKKLVWK